MRQRLWKACVLLVVLASLRILCDRAAVNAITRCMAAIVVSIFFGAVACCWWCADDSARSRSLQVNRSDVLGGIRVGRPRRPQTYHINDRKESNDATRTATDPAEQLAAEPLCAGEEAQRPGT